MERQAKTPRAWRVRTPTMLQMEAVECGAAALGIIMGHYRKYVSLEELRQICGVSRDGSKASSVVKAARTFGFEAGGYRYEPAELRALGTPVIIFWNFNHFLVVEGVGDGVVYLNDPASGPRTVSTEEFDQGFTGVTLVITPGENFIASGDQPGLANALRSRLPLREPALRYLLLAGLLMVIPGLVVPVFSKVFIDSYLVGHSTNWVKPLLIGMGVTAALRGLLTWLQSHYLNRFHAKLALTTASRFFWHVLRLPVIFYSQRSPGDISARVAINNRVAVLLTGDLASAMLNCLVVVFYAALMLSYDVTLTLVGIAVAAANVLFLRFVSRRRTDTARRLANDGGKLMGTSMNGLQLIETLKASGMETDFFSKWAGYHAKVFNGQQAMGAQEVVLMSVPPLLTTFNSILILSLGGLQVMNGVMTMGALIAFQSLMASFIDPVNQLVGMGSKIQQVQGDLNRLDDVLKYRPDPSVDAALVAPRAAATDSTSAPTVIRRLQGNIELRNVTFGYSRLEAPLIEGLNLTLRPGSRVALVGASGCGKSTVSRLVMGLYDPWDGDILFDGQPRARWPRATLVNSIAMVSQDIVLFEGSLRDNLTLWDDTLPEDQVIAATRDACIHDAIVTRQGGYDSKVQEGGANFSGGQRQRLEIARALAIDPRILVLDEATSALDPITEMQLDRNLRRRGCTCLIIAHRLSTIRDCDEIIVLDRGKVVQRGTHAAMCNEAGPYAALMHAA